jgi:hypothetical protein
MNELTAQFQTSDAVMDSLVAGIALKSMDDLVRPSPAWPAAGARAKP